MTTVVYDHAPDVSESSVMHAVYWNNETKVLYLVFNNGTVSSRQLPPGFQSRHLDAVYSWGSWWNNYLKELPGAERVENGANFVHREQAPEPEPVAEAPASAAVLTVDDTLVDVFVRSYDAYQNANNWFGSHEEAVRAGLKSVAAFVNAEAAAKAAGAESDLLPGVDPAEHYAREGRLRGWDAEPEPEAEGNDDDTFVGIGFFDVPETLRPTLDKAVEFFDEFVQEQVGKVESSIESYTRKTLREAFRRFVQ